MSGIGNKITGRRGEELAIRYLLDRGWMILDAPFSHKTGEIDIVARDPGGVTVFIEVKTRRSLRFGHPAEAVTAHKQRRILRVAKCWLARHHKDTDVVVRFDVIAVLLTGDGVFRIEHLPAAFSA